MNPARIGSNESEEMQRLNKIRAQEIEKQKANQINNKSQVLISSYLVTSNDLQ